MPASAGQTGAGGIARARTAGRSVARRLLATQESGLILVILIMGAILTFTGGTKETPTLKNVPAAAAVDTSSEPGWIVVRHGESETRYDAGQWRYVETSRVRRLIGPRVEVNKFLDFENLVQVVKDASFIAIMAVGMTAIIILAGIDLSIGSVYGLAALVGGLALHALQSGAEQTVSGWLSVPVGLLVCGAVGAACGAANGAMIVGLRVHPFVITLGTMAAFRGLIQVVSQGQSVGGFPASFTSGFFKAGMAGVYPVPVFIMVLVAIAGAFILARTVFGRRIYAIGGNETAARYAGVPVGAVQFAVYTLAGMLAGLSACVYLGYLGAAEPAAGTMYELKVIAAAVIGGASLMGGRGSALGAVLGAILIELINNGMVILNIPQDYTRIVMGAAIIIAVAVDQAKGRFAGRT
jgi:ribose/xylose/arabinose/galactoside ABC-type transport system permease subunit